MDIQEKINKKLIKYRNKLISTSEPNKQEFYNIKMQQYLLLQKKADSSITNNNILVSDTTEIFGNQHEIKPEIKPIENIVATYFIDRINQIKDSGNQKKINKTAEQLKILDDNLKQLIFYSLPRVIIPDEIYNAILPNNNK